MPCFLGPCQDCRSTSHILAAAVLVDMLSAGFFGRSAELPQLQFDLNTIAVQRRGCGPAGSLLGRRNKTIRDFLFGASV